jgi:pimeloyl-ACP methyl ester carboxylesterase
MLGSKSASSADPLPSAGVVLLHGLGSNRATMAYIDHALKQAGYDTLRLSYPSRKHILRELADGLAPDINAFAEAIIGPLHFVTHSLGGLVVRSFLERHSPKRMGRVVMLGPPNGGSELADLVTQLGFDQMLLGKVGGDLATRCPTGAMPSAAPLSYELGIIAGNRSIDPIFPKLIIKGPNDGKVSVASTKLAGMTDHLVLPVSHTLMIVSPMVARQVINFLDVGQFSRV